MLMEASIELTFGNIKRGVKRKLYKKPNRSVFDPISGPLRHEFLLVFDIISGSL